MLNWHQGCISRVGNTLGRKASRLYSKGREYIRKEGIKVVYQKVGNMLGPRLYIIVVDIQRKEGIKIVY